MNSLLSLAISLTIIVFSNIFNFLKEKNLLLQQGIIIASERFYITVIRFFFFFFKIRCFVKED